MKSPLRIFFWIVTVPARIRITTMAGADFQRAAADGMTLAKMLEAHRTFFATTDQEPPAEFVQLAKWMDEHDAVQAEAR